MMTIKLFDTAVAKVSVYVRCQHVAGSVIVVVVVVVVVLVHCFSGYPTQP